MTSADHTPADQAVAQRARADDPATPPRAGSGGAGPGLLNQMTENPALSLFGAIIVVLLGFVLTTSNIRITETNDRITRLDNRIEDRFNRIEDRFDRIEDRFNRIENRIDRIENRIVSLESTVAGIDRKLTALIAALGKTDEVEGALSANAGGIPTARPLDEAEDR